MIELRDPWPVKTPHGEGRVLVIVDYGLNNNGILLVGLDSGALKYYSTHQVRLIPNQTLIYGKRNQDTVIKLGHHQGYSGRAGKAGCKVRGAKS